MFDPTQRTQMTASTPINVDGEVVEVLKGCGVAVVRGDCGEEISLNKGTDGVHFDELQIGQKVNCDLTATTGRVIRAHQQTRPIRACDKR